MNRMYINSTRICCRKAGMKTFAAFWRYMIYVLFPDVSFLSVQEGYWLIHFVPRNCSTPPQTTHSTNSLPVKSTAFTWTKTIFAQQATCNSAVWKGWAAGSEQWNAMSWTIWTLLGMKIVQIAELELKKCWVLDYLWASSIYLFIWTKQTWRVSTWSKKCTT